MARPLPTFETARRIVEETEALAKLMDASFTIPGTEIKLGLDALVGFIPVIGDTASLGINGFIMSRAFSLGMPTPQLALMAANIFIDWLIGLIPLIGDIFDIGFKANLRNAAMMRKWFENTFAGHDVGVMPEDLVWEG